MATAWTTERAPWITPWTTQRTSTKAENGTAPTGRGVAGSWLGQELLTSGSACADVHGAVLLALSSEEVKVAIKKRKLLFIETKELRLNLLC